MGAGEVSADPADWRRWRFPTHACGDPVSQGKLGGARRIELGGNAPVFRAGSARTSNVLLLSGGVRVQVIGEGGAQGGALPGAAWSVVRADDPLHSPGDASSAERG